MLAGRACSLARCTERKWAYCAGKCAAVGTGADGCGGGADTRNVRLHRDRYAGFALVRWHPLSRRVAFRMPFPAEETNPAEMAHSDDDGAGFYDAEGQAPSEQVAFGYKAPELKPSETHFGGGKDSRSRRRMRCRLCGELVHHLQLL